MRSKQIVLMVLVVVVTSAVVSVATVAFVKPHANIDLDSSNQLIRDELDQLKDELVDSRKVTAELEQRLLASQSNVVRSVPPIKTLTELELGGDEEPAESEEQELVQTQPIALSRNDFRRQNLLENGFAEDEANWVLRNEAQVQLDSLYEQYRARRTQLELDAANGTSATRPGEQLRDKLGEDYYERYLKANGFPISVNVGSVLDGSPGASAGLQRGDRILSYNGERVFNIRELNGLTVQGDEGKSVLVEVERDGNPVQITLPRGPIGITGGRGRF